MSDDGERPTMSAFVCSASDFHPYECGFENCIHCEGKKTETHDPKTCALCNWQGELG